jgi:hypothetical protein
MQVRELSDEGMPPVAHADEEYKKYYRDIAESLVDYLKVKQG